VKKLMRATLKPQHRVISTINPNEAPTHERVPQFSVPVRSMENILPTLYELIQRERKVLAEANTGYGFRAMILFNTSNSVKLAAETFRNLRVASTESEAPGSFNRGPNPLYPLKFIEMHGQLSQDQRTWAAKAFKESLEVILFTSDVTAHGMDFPNMYHVIQIGKPRNHVQYIHRIGRTACRATMSIGTGYLLFSGFERKSVKDMLRSLPLKPHESTLGAADVDMSQPAELNREAAEALSVVTQASKAIPKRMMRDAYMATLGFTWTRTSDHLLRS